MEKTRMQLFGIYFGPGTRSRINFAAGESNYIEFARPGTELGTICRVVGKNGSGKSRLTSWIAGHYFSLEGYRRDSFLANSKPGMRASRSIFENGAAIFSLKETHEIIAVPTFFEVDDEWAAGDPIDNPPSWSLGRETATARLIWLLLGGRVPDQFSQVKVPIRLEIPFREFLRDQLDSGFFRHLGLKYNLGKEAVDLSLTSLYLVVSECLNGWYVYSSVSAEEWNAAQTEGVRWESGRSLYPTASDHTSVVMNESEDGLCPPLIIQRERTLIPLFDLKNIVPDFNAVRAHRLLLPRAIEAGNFGIDSLDFESAISKLTKKLARELSTHFEVPHSSMDESWFIPTQADQWPYDSFGEMGRARLGAFDPGNRGQRLLPMAFAVNPLVQIVICRLEQLINELIPTIWTTKSLSNRYQAKLLMQHPSLWERQPKADGRVLKERKIQLFVEETSLETQVRLAGEEFPEKFPLNVDLYYPAEQAGSALRRWVALAAEIAIGMLNEGLHIDTKKLGGLDLGKFSDTPNRDAFIHPRNRWFLAKAATNPDVFRELSGLIDSGLGAYAMEVDSMIFIDEPEAYLAPDMKVEITKWIADIATKTMGVVMTTHDCNMVSLQGTDNALVTLSREGTEVRILNERLTPAVKSTWVKEMQCANRLSLYRKIVFVEGEHELLILKHFCKEQLEEFGIWIAVLDGELNKQFIYKAQNLWPYFSAELQNRQYLFLLDQPVEENRRDIRNTSELVSFLKEQLASVSIGSASHSHFVSLRRHSQFDIWMLLPEDAVRKALNPNPDFAGWKPALESYRETTKQPTSKGFKAFCREKYGMALNSRNLTAVLRQVGKVSRGELGKFCELVLKFGSEQDFDFEELVL